MNEINDNGNCPICLSNLKEPYINCVDCQPNTQLCLRVSILTFQYFKSCLLTFDAFHPSIHTFNHQFYDTLKKHSMNRSKDHPNLMF